MLQIVTTFCLLDAVLCSAMYDLVSNGNENLRQHHYKGEAYRRIVDTSLLAMGENLLPTRTVDSLLRFAALITINLKINEMDSKNL